MYSMYNIEKFKHGNYVTVGEVIAELEKLNKDAVFTCCGDYDIYLHVSKDDKVVTIDNTDLCDNYYEEVNKEEHEFGGKIDSMVYEVEFKRNSIIYWVKREEFDNSNSETHVYWSKITQDELCYGVYSKELLRIIS